MKLSSFLLAVSTLLSVSAQAKVSWVGNLQFHEVRRGSHYDNSMGSEALDINLCDYGTFTITFEAYKAGVTDVPNSSVWQGINAQMATVQDANGAVITTGSPAVVGQNGNNAVYSIYLRGMSPSTVTSLNPASKDTHLVVTLDGEKELSLPIHFRCDN